MPRHIAEVRIIDHGFGRIRQEIRELDRQSIKVGIQSDAGTEPDGTTIVMVAAFNEFGSDRSPSRPFFRHMADTQRDRLVRVATAAYNTIFTGSTATVVLAMVGQWYEGAQKLVLRDGPWVPNHPITIARKKSSTPLIDTARMVNAIRYVVQSGKR